MSLNVLISNAPEFSSDGSQYHQYSPLYLSGVRNPFADFLQGIEEYDFVLQV